jgi:hypothetical protein
MRFKSTSFIVTAALIVGVAAGIHLGHNGVERLPLVGEAKAAGR